MLKKILIIVAILMVSSLVTTGVGYNYSIDVVGWWPVGILFDILLYSIYAAVFVLIDRVHASSKKYIIFWHIVLSVIFTLLGIFFYTVKIDWGSINNGIEELTILETILQSAWTIYVVLFISLISHLAARLFVRKK